MCLHQSHNVKFHNNEGTQILHWVQYTHLRANPSQFVFHK
ncbi:hypothetical protein VIBHAR_06804 [Vibrio campbellii ATCC BAA-1116]|uniref:Uncharacterized protein n=1 Tax=Vibrio campbellii (strain ATCC BAA-1116) TaxID=2902295 RepID=A7N7W0_VIBC1|nr:hypothetical protein VIBHAR_06804 [Vibrio campbellii ATCC BAA-1116]